MRKINKIILHCSATPEVAEANVEDIRRWHLRRGFFRHWLSLSNTPDGRIEKGRPIEKQGAHCSGQNGNSIGICYVGGMDKEMKKAKDTRTPQQKDALIYLMHELIYKYNQDMTIHGHNEFANKACPSFNVK